MTTMNEKNFTNAESVGRKMQTMDLIHVVNYVNHFTVATVKNTETIDVI